MRVARKPKEIHALIQDAAVVIRSQMPKLREDRDTPKHRAARVREINDRARHLVKYCLDRPVTADG